MPPVHTLDFEASCLPQHGRSFPIEVGVCAPDGTAQAWLIRPDPAWRDWTWTPEAEELHGLTRAQLERDGLPAAEVLTALRAAVGYQPVYADSYFDAAWMRTLEAAAGAPPMLKVDHVEALIHRWDVSDATVARALAEVSELPFRRHRAAEDARWLQALVTRFDNPAPRERTTASQRAFEAA